MSISARTFALQRLRQFGTANPSRMPVEFWEYMVHTGQSAYAASQRFDPNGQFESGPVWSFRRFGPTRTPLPDGTVVCIGGEHEDHYDPDFCIYNDVIVVRPDGHITICGYPKDTFPPTDFHTATFTGDRIILIGGLGYHGERGGDETPVYSLDLRTFSITRLPTSGQSPGWIYEHRATLIAGDESIRISGGTVIRGRGRDESSVGNRADYILSLRTFQWEVVDPEPDRDVPLPTGWPDPWEPVLDSGQAQYIRRQLLNELPPGHPLFAANVRAWAESGPGDDILFKLLDGPKPYAQLCPTWEETGHTPPPGPPTRFFDSFDQWLTSTPPQDPPRSSRPFHR